MTAYNIEFHATFLSSTADIEGRVIYFGPGVKDEKLLIVPIGRIDPHATVVVTVGLNKSHSNDPKVDADPNIGISDGTNENLIQIVDRNNYPKYAPCYPRPGSSDDVKVTAETLVSATFKLTFDPFNKLGICETAQEDGYINTGTFSAQIDITRPLSFTLNRQDAKEQYYFHYFNVEIY